MFSGMGTFFMTLYKVKLWARLLSAQHRKRMELLHDIMKGRDYRHLKDLISDRSRWRQDSK